MPDFVAFLRGINVGGHRVKMERLRTLFEDMDFADVSTFIASGNVHFTAAVPDRGEVRRRIEGGLAEALGYEVATFLRTPERLAEIVPETTPEPGTSHYVLFLHGPAPADLRAALAELESETDRFTFDGHEAHWWIQGKMSASPLFGGPIDRVLKDLSHTMRNVNTLRRILAKVGPR